MRKSELIYSRERLFIILCELDVCPVPKFSHIMRSVDDMLRANWRKVYELDEGEEVSVLDLV